VASSAPPSPFVTASGYSSSDRTLVTEVARGPLLEFASPSEPDRVSAARAPSHRRRLSGTGVRQARDRLSWGSRSLERHYVGCPFSPRRDRDPAAEGEGRQALTGAVLRVPAPLDGSGRARGTHETLAGPVVRRDAPTLRGLVSCRSRPWSRPSELSLLEEPYPLSRASCSLAGSRSTAQRRGSNRGFRDPFPRRADLFATASARLAGLQGRDDGSPESLDADRVRVATRVFDASPRIGRARRTRRPERPLRSFAPLESPFPARLHPWPGCGRWVGALLGFFFPSRACSNKPVGPVHARTCSTGPGPISRVLESSSPGHAYSPGSSSDRGV